jgi:hypothetical protein
MAKSLMEQIALLPPEQQAAILADMNMDDLIWDWQAWGRPEQQAPDGDWNGHEKKQSTQMKVYCVSVL